MMLARWLSTVRSLMPSSAAMTLLRLPSMTPASTSFARVVSACCQPVLSAVGRSFRDPADGRVYPLDELSHVEGIFDDAESAEAHRAHGSRHVRVAGEAGGSS